MSARISIVCVILLLSACFPATYSFYAPSGVGSAVEGSACTTGVRDIWVMRLTNNVEAAVSVAESKGSNSTLSFGLLVPEGHTAQLLTADFVLDSANFSGPIRVSATEFVASCEVPKPQCSIDRLPATDLLRGASAWKTVLFSKHETKRTFNTSLRIPTIQQFTVQPPPIAVDGTTVEPPLLRFTKTSKIGWTALCQ